jgi:hypothetical protein
MGVQQRVLVALIVAAVVFAGLTAIAITSSESLSPDYFDTAGKYIHRL